MGKIYFNCNVRFSQVNDPIAINTNVMHYPVTKINHFIPEICFLFQVFNLKTLEKEPVAELRSCAKYPDNVQKRS
jgi:hypothetical protein